MAFHISPAKNCHSIRKTGLVLNRGRIYLLTKINAIPGLAYEMWRKRNDKSFYVYNIDLDGLGYLDTAPDPQWICPNPSWKSFYITVEIEARRVQQFMKIVVKDDAAVVCY